MLTFLGVEFPPTTTQIFKESAHTRVYAQKMLIFEQSVVAKCPFNVLFCKKPASLAFSGIFLSQLHIAKFVRHDDLSVLQIQTEDLFLKPEFVSKNYRANFRSYRNARNGGVSHISFRTIKAYAHARAPLAAKHLFGFCCLIVLHLLADCSRNGCRSRGE
jgi:hypothetical protein